MNENLFTNAHILDWLNYFNENCEIGRAHV